MECELFSGTNGRAKSRSRSCIYAFISMSSFSSISATYIANENYFNWKLFNHTLFLEICVFLFYIKALKCDNYSRNYQSIVRTDRSTFTTRDAKLIFDAYTSLAFDPCFPSIWSSLLIEIIILNMSIKKRRKD